MFHRTASIFFLIAQYNPVFSNLKKGITLLFSLGPKEITNLGIKTSNSKSKCNIKEINSLYKKENPLDICTYIFMLKQNYCPALNWSGHWYSLDGCSSSHIGQGRREKENYFFA